jgi:hypothetical protein
MTNSMDNWRGVCMASQANLLGLESRGLANSNEGDTKVTNSRTGCVTIAMELLTINNRIGQGACASLFIVGDKGSYYNVLNVSNYLPHQ